MKKYANRFGWSDIHPFEVIEVRTPRKVIIRSMNAELAADWKPEVILGGFFGHTVNNDEQRWDITSDPDGHSFPIRLNKRGTWVDKAGNKYGLADEPRRKYDWNF